MRVTKVRAFKAAAVVAAGGVGASSFWSEASASWAVNRDGAVKTTVDPAPDTTTVDSVPDAGPVVAKAGSVSITDSSDLPVHSDTSDVDQGTKREVELSEVGDDTPVPPPPLAAAPSDKVGSADQSRASAASGQTISAASVELCYGTWFRPRGFNLTPSPDHQIIWYDAPGSGYEIRRLLGMECFGDNQNFTFANADGFKASGFNSTYGRRVVHKDGWVFEGCQSVVIQPFGVSQYQCDFKASGGVYKLNLQKSGAFWRERLRNWSTQTVQSQGQCATTIVGLWVGTNDLNDVAVDCIDNGPINPNGL